MEVGRKRLFTNRVVPREGIHVITCEMREELRFEPRTFKSAADYESTFYLLCDGCSCPKVSIQVLQPPSSLERDFQHHIRSLLLLQFSSIKIEIRQQRNNTTKLVNTPSLLIPPTKHFLSAFNQLIFSFCHWNKNTCSFCVISKYCNNRRMQPLITEITVTRENYSH